jgi:phospholipase C
MEGELMSRRSGLVAALAGLIGLASVTASAAGPVTALTRPAYVPPIKHVFVINIENKGYDTTWGDNSAAPYLAQTLRERGVLLADYYSTAHNSQPNYVAEISGQGPNPQMQGDCQIYSDFAQANTVAPQQAVGQGCVFPAGVNSLPMQMQRHRLTWKGYMEGMKTPCMHPPINSQDPTQQAKVGAQYAVRHDPFMYFHAIIDKPRYCARHVVSLSRLPDDLKSVATTPNLSYITPNLCNDGHDSPCVGGRPGGLKSINTWMKTWVPLILNSPAYQKNGMLIITADESDSPQSDASACCGEGPGPNTPLPGIFGLGGGVVGALVLSHWTEPDTWSTTPYNHYSLLASMEEIFGLPKLGYARTAGLNRFGLDVYNNGWK